MYIINQKPWRDTKIKYLTYQYRPWKESYKERYQGAPSDSDRIYIYGIPSSRLGKNDNIFIYIYIIEIIN